MISYSAANSWLASTSTVNNWISGCSLAILCNNGFKTLHGPHHTAQKSTIVSFSDFTASSNWSFDVISIIFLIVLIIITIILYLRIKS